jgi:tetratricopeptide (TPR) repeat protein
MGGPRFIGIQLSNRAMKPQLTSENVNAGDHYYFLIRTMGGWTMEEEFASEDLSKLFIVQAGRRMSYTWKGEPQRIDTTSNLLVGFPKELRLHESFDIQYDLGGTYHQVSMSVPMTCWPGYSIVTQLYTESENLSLSKRYREAISVYEQLLANSALKIFPEYEKAKEDRTKAFQAYYSEANAQLIEITNSVTTPLKEKIRRIESSKPMVQFVADSLVRRDLGISLADSTVGALTRLARETLLHADGMRDSLQRVVDEQASEWIVKGSLSGRPLFLVELAAKAISYAVAQIDFAETTTTELKLTIPMEFHPDLVKHKILEDCESFLRVCNDRFHLRMPMFPAQFLTSLKRDTSSFSLPYYSMLKAVNDYFYGDNHGAENEIFKVFRTCFDPMLLEKFDYMRVLINMRTDRVPTEALQLISEAERAAARKDPEAALDNYLQATIMAPDFAYGFYLLGKYYVRTGENIRAQTFFQKAYQIDQQFLSAYRSAYVLYVKEANFKPMIEVLLLALQNGNNYWETNSSLGQAYMGDGDPAKAIQAYEKALSLNPKSYQTYIHLGLAHQTTKNYRRAREYFTRATELDPQRQEAVEFMKKLNELERGSR